MNPVARAAMFPVRLSRARALRILKQRGCERYNTSYGIGGCLDAGHDPIAKYGADQACAPCIAWSALKRKRWTTFGAYSEHDSRESR